MRSGIGLCVRRLINIRASRRAVLAAAIAAAAPHVRADAFFDADGLGPPGGGSGQWNTTLPRWAADPASAGYAAWTNGPTVANFAGGGTRVVNASAPAQAGGITLSATNATLNLTTSGGSVTLVAPAAGAAPGVDVAAGSTLLMPSNAGVAANLGLTKTGAGTFVFNGTLANNGPVDIQAGTVVNPLTFAPFGATAAVNIGAAGAFQTGNNNVAFGSLSGSGTVGLGTVSPLLAGIFGYPTNGGAGAANFGFGGLLQVGANNASTTFSGSITGTGGRFTKLGTGTTTLTGNNTFDSFATVQGGVLELGAADGATLNPNAPVFLGNVAGATLRLLSNQAIGSLGGGGTTGGVVAIGASTLTVGNDAVRNSDAGYNLYAGALTGTGTFVKTGPGVQVLGNAANPFAGKYKIDGGSLLFNVSGSLTNAAAPAADTPDYVTLNGGTLGNYMGAGGTVALGANRGITVAADSTVATWNASFGSGMALAGSLNGSRQLTKVGNGNFNIASNNAATFSGNWVIRGGIVQGTAWAPVATPAASFGTGNIDIATATLAVGPGKAADGTTVADVGMNVATGAGSKMTFGPGATLQVGRNTNPSLTVNIGDPAATTPGLVAGPGGTLLVQTNVDTPAQLGTTTKVLVNGAVDPNGGTPVVRSGFLVNGIVRGLMTAPTIASGSTIDFVGYDVNNGLVRATYSPKTDLKTATAADVFNVTTAQSLAGAGVGVYALRVNQVVNANGQTITIGDNTPSAAMLVLNGSTANDATITNGTVNFRGNRGVIAANDLANNVEFFSARIAGTNGVTFTGNNIQSVSYANQGEVKLASNSTYAGPTLISGAAVSLIADDALPTTTDLTLANWGRLKMFGSRQTVRSLNAASWTTAIDFAGGGTLTVGAGDSTYLGSIVNGNVLTTGDVGTLVKDGTGTLFLGSANSQAGIGNPGLAYYNLQVRGGGTVSLSAAGLPPAGGGDPETGVTVPTITLDNGTVKLTQLTTPSFANGGASSVALGNRFFVTGPGGGTLHIAHSGELVTWGSQAETALPAASTHTLRGSGDFTKAGPGRLVVSQGNDTFTGRFIVDGGSLQASTDWQTQQNAAGATFFGNAFGQSPTSFRADGLILRHGAMLYMNGGASNVVPTGSGGSTANHGYGPAIHPLRGVTLGEGGGGAIIARFASPISGTGELIHEDLRGGSAIFLDSPNRFNTPSDVYSGAAVPRNSYSGGTRILGGYVHFNGAGSAGTGAVTADPEYFVAGIAKSNGPDVDVTGGVVLKKNIGYVDFVLTGGNQPNDLFTAAPAFSSTPIGAMTVSGKVTGAADWYKGLNGGNNQLILTNSTNDFTGVLNVVTGAVVVKANNALGATGNGTVVNNTGTLAFDGGVNYAAAEPLAIAGAGGTGSNNTGALNSIAGANTFAGPVTVTSDASINVAAGSLNLSGGVAGGTGTTLTKTGAGALTLKGLTTSGLAVNGGTVALAHAPGGNDNTAATLALAAGSVLDLNNNTLTLATGSVAAIHDAILAAYDHGAWDGASGAAGMITSTDARNDAGRATAIAYRDTGSSIVLKYTWYGDANADGVVTSADQAALAAGLNSGGVLAGWQNGDFNYDGAINADDWALFNYGAAISGGAPIAAVPEPAVMAPLGLAGLAMLGRRSRRRRPICNDSAV
jgi:autotransporter-associated beta strand protein